MTLETILPFLEGILAGRKKVWESGLVFVEVAAEALLGSFLCLHLFLLMSEVSAVRAEGFPWEVPGKAAAPEPSLRGWCCCVG